MKLKLPTACLLLTGSVLGLLAIAGVVAYSRSGVLGLKAAVLAAGVCWFAATGALLVTGWSRSSSHATAGILVASGLRLGLPLVIGLWLQRSGGDLAEVGVFGWIVVFYLVTLIVETTLSVLLDRKESSANGKGQVTHG